MRISEAARLLANETHCIETNCDNVELLKKVLRISFPKDEDTDRFNFELDDDIFFGYHRHQKGCWGNNGNYLEDLEIIKLSDIIEEADNEVSNDELEFERIVDETLLSIRETLIVKGKEYRRNNNPFHNFEVGAMKKNITREKALDGMLLKHEISIEDMTNDLDSKKLPSESSVNEKFGDNLIYLILKKAMFIDRINKSKQTNNQNI